MNLQHTCIKEKKHNNFEATGISTVQMLKCIGSFYWLYNTMNINQQYMYMLRLNILCVDETLFYMCEYSDAIKLPKYCVININVYSGDRKNRINCSQ